MNVSLTDKVTGIPAPAAGADPARKEESDAYLDDFGTDPTLTFRDLDDATPAANGTNPRVSRCPDAASPGPGTTGRQTLEVRETDQDPWVKVQDYNLTISGEGTVQGLVPPGWEYRWTIGEATAADSAREYDL